MINNKEKIENCSSQIINLVNFLEKTYGTVTITSGFRTPEENAKVGGAKDSAHTKGLAVDIVIPDVSCIKVAAKVLDNRINYPVLGLGLDVFQNYVHFDFMSRGISGVTYWVYNRSGQAI